MKRYSIWIIVSMLTFLTGCPPAPKTSDVYYIMFDRPPNLVNTSVYAMGDDIGDIVSQEFGVNHIGKLTITIAPEYRDLLRENAVFYVSRGLLTYDTVSNYGELLDLESKILGFPSKAAVNWFKTKTLLTHPAQITRKKANALFDAFEPK